MTDQDQKHKESDPEALGREERQREQGWQRRFAIFSLVFDGIVAVSAIAGGFFIWEQLVLLRESNAETAKNNTRILEQMRESNKIAIDAFRYGTGAGVAVESVSSPYEPQQRKSWVFTVQVRNFGHRAVTVTVSGDMVLTDYITSPDTLLSDPETKDPLRPRCAEQKGGFLTEMQKKRLERGQVASFYVYGNALTQEQAKAFESGDLVATLVGCVIARGEGIERRTRLCASLHTTDLRFRRMKELVEEGYRYDADEWTACSDNNVEETEESSAD